MMKLTTLTLLFAVLFASTACAAVKVDRGNVDELSIVVNPTGAEGKNVQALRDAAMLVQSSFERALGESPNIVETAGDGPSIIIARADQYPDIVGKLKIGNPDAYAIVTRGRTVYLLGASEAAAGYAAAELLHELGFRFYNPSPNWWLTPESDTLVIDLNTTSAPQLRGRGIWYAYGVKTPSLVETYRIWAAANRLGSAAPLHSGHSYGNIVGRNQEAFAAHPEYYAMNEAGERPITAPASTKFCFSNPGLLELVAKDRLALLQANQKANPLEFMVSVDPSDGRGTCHCKDCQAIGTNTDRVIYLANYVARYLRKHDPDAWVGLYAYSSHRYPPTIDVEPNVYIQVAMGFNRSPYTLPELVARWGEKAGAVGLREYYGVEAWDWGLPGRMRGGRVDYLTQWIPYYAAKNLNAVNAESNANWGDQTPGGYIAARLMWDPNAEVKPLIEEFFTRGFGKAQAPIRRLYARMDRGPQLEVAQLTAMFDDLAEANKLAQDPAVKARITDLMAYMHYVALFREFSLAMLNDPRHGETFYNALGPLLNFAWRSRERNMYHYYALARRLANGLPLGDGRFEYWMMLNEKNRPNQAQLDRFKVDPATLPNAPVWMHGDPPGDAEIHELFELSRKALASDKRLDVFFSRYLDYAYAPGTDAGPSVAPSGKKGTARFDGPVTAWLATQADETYPMDITPIDGKAGEVIGYARGEDVHQQQTFDKPTHVVMDFGRANDYRLVITGNFELSTQEDLPLSIEASPQSPLGIRRSGPLYFYVPRGVEELIISVKGSATIHMPRHGEIVVKGDGEYQRLAVPEDAAGTLWHFTAATDGTVALVNVPPLVHLHRTMFLSVREVSQSDGLTTMTPEQVEAGRWKP